VNKIQVARWCSVLVLGALAVGCGHRSDNGGNKPQAVTPAGCVPAPAGEKVPSSAAAAAAPTQTAAPAQTAAKSAEKPAEKPVKVKVVDVDAPLKVRRLVVAEDVERGKREPVGAGTSFKVTKADRLYAFVEVENPEKAESEVFVTFEPQDNGASQGQVSLRVGASPRWRTWAYTRGVKKAGSWAAVVRSKDGAVLARTPFEVTL
jgi:hypothetical protein